MHPSGRNLITAAILLLVLGTATAKTYRIGHRSDAACDRMIAGTSHRRSAQQSRRRHHSRRDGQL